MRLLWIDDDLKLVNASTPVFHRYGFEIVSAATLSRALTILRAESNQLDGILLDVRLGAGENGIEFLADLKDRYPDLRVVIFTAYPDYNDHLDAIESGATVYLQKVRKSIPADERKQTAFFESLRRAFKGAHASYEKQPAQRARRASMLWQSGAFFLFVFVVVIAGMFFLSYYVSPWLLPVVLLGGILFYAVVGAFILRIQGDGSLSEKNFISLIKDALRYLPQLKLPTKDKFEKSDND
ncbi:MAG TPA: response regulator [Thermoanaerobaculia bacterium]|jgi:ActR/RegA family two-component response regulator|nr:response regulator [Thermoanaerobaculia bacterium]